VKYCGINFADILICQGKYQAKIPVPFTPGTNNDYFMRPTDSKHNFLVKLINVLTMVQKITWNFLRPIPDQCLKMSPEFGSIFMNKF